MKMSKVVFQYLALAALVCLSGGTAVSAAEPVAAKNSLWKVEGGKSTIHLLGSIHFLKKDFYPLPPPIEAAYHQARIVAFETDFAVMEDPKTQARMLELGQCPVGESLRDHLSPETYKALQAYLEKSVGFGAVFDRFKPWFAAMTLAVIELQKLGFDPAHGVDKHFHRRARADGKEIVALETVDYQIDLLAGLAKEDQEALIKETLQEIGSFKTVFADVVAAWKTGDAQKLDRLILENMKAFPQIHKKLLIDRNRNWTTKIETLLRGDKNAFVVVGAGHLVGTNSVVDLLQKKGFKVTQQ